VAGQSGNDRTDAETSNDLDAATAPRNTYNVVIIEKNILTHKEPITLRVRLQLDHIPRVLTKGKKSAPDSRGKM
jgi:hypothetical protein